MAAKIHVLAEGYAQEISGDRMNACGSCCLVETGRSRVLFDTMGPWDRQLLIDELASRKIHPDDIDYVVCSHGHPDHIGNLNLFTKARLHFVGMSVYNGDQYNFSYFQKCGTFQDGSKELTDQSLPDTDKKSDETTKITTFTSFEAHQLDDNLTILPTPGHTNECISMIVRNCDQFGTVALAGDLFENEHDIDNEQVWISAGSQNPDSQRAYRFKIYTQVDYIIPGHGPIFRTNHSRVL